MRLIDADAVAEAIKDEITEAKGIDAGPNFIAGLKLGLAYINTAESIDAEPVRHGRWVIDDEYIDCSVCRREKWSRVPFEDLVKHFKYCPKCGAKMEPVAPWYQVEGGRQ